MCRSLDYEIVVRWSSKLLNCAQYPELKSKLLMDVRYKVTATSVATPGKKILYRNFINWKTFNSLPKFVVLKYFGKYNIPNYRWKYMFKLDSFCTFLKQIKRLSPQGKPKYKE